MFLSMNEPNPETEHFNVFVYGPRLKLIIDCIIILIIAWLFSGLVLSALAGSLYFAV